MNWLRMERRLKGEMVAGCPETRGGKGRSHPHPLPACNPDVLGVCEIGTEEDVADLQARLQIRRSRSAASVRPSRRRRDATARIALALSRRRQPVGR